MVNRLELHTKLESILDSKNVYFQPPESIKINYPAIIYFLDDLENIHADDGVYLLYKRFYLILEKFKCRQKEMFIIAEIRKWA